MEPITINQWLGIFVGIITLIPGLYLLKQYSKMKILDYLLFSLFFFSGFILLVADPAASSINLLFFFQIHHLAIDFAFLILFLHSVRMVWLKPPRIILIIGIGWYTILAIFTFSWHLMIQPASNKFIFWDIPHTFSSYYPKGAGLKIRGVLIYSTAHRFWGESFRVFVISLMAFAYLTVEPINPTPRIIRGKRLWLLAILALAIHTISLFPWFGITKFISIFILIGGAIIVYIAIVTPECLLLSHAQIFRVMQLYRDININKIDLDSSRDYSRDTIIEYIRKIPIEALNQFKTEII